VHKFCDQIKEVAKEQISADKQRVLKFSFSLDEWVDVTARKFFNVTLIRSDGGVINLGIVRIIGS